MRDEPRHEPTPEQIADACRQIQAEWTADEELRRRVVKPQPVEMPGSRYAEVVDHGAAREL